MRYGLTLWHPFRSPPPSLPQAKNDAFAEWHIWREENIVRHLLLLIQWELVNFWCIANAIYTTDERYYGIVYGFCVAAKMFRCEHNWICKWILWICDDAKRLGIFSLRKRCTMYYMQWKVASQIDRMFDTTFVFLANGGRRLKWLDIGKYPLICGFSSSACLKLC